EANELRASANPQDHIEDAFFAVMERHGIQMSVFGKPQVRLALKIFHPLTYHEFMAKPVEEQRRSIALMAAIAWPEFQLRQAAAARQNGQKGATPDFRFEFLRTQFPANVPEQPGFAPLLARIRQAAAEIPDVAGPFHQVMLYIQGR